MTVAAAANIPAFFEIKSANLPLVALMLKTTDLAGLADELARRFGDSPDFFDHDPLVIDLSPLPDAAAVPDFPTLLSLLRQYRLAPLAAKGGSPAQMKAALVAGLAATPDIVASAPVVETVVQEVVREVPVAGAGTLVIDKPLRSGQQVYAKGGDLVVLAMVNPGAEVIADGHIHVYAPLRGKAIAGARGNTGARIFSLSLEAELVSIAGTYRTSETALPAQVRGQPTQIRLAGDKLVMEALKA